MKIEIDPKEIIMNGKKLEPVTKEELEFEYNPTPDWSEKSREVIYNIKAGWSEEAQKALEEREKLELNYKPSLKEAWERISEDSPNKQRYEHECIKLFYLTKQQLNLEKNAKKGAFEDLCNLKDIIDFLNEEVSELKDELFETWCSEGYYKPTLTTKKEKIDYQRAREEIGDVAACLVGLLAKLDKMEKEENENR